jgi:hypothetical protein
MEENKNTWNFYGAKITKYPFGRPRLLRAQ